MESQQSFFPVPDAIISTSSREQLAVATAAEKTQTYAALNGKEGTGGFQPACACCEVTRRRVTSNVLFSFNICF